jgi:hypothetical protein
MLNTDNFSWSLSQAIPLVNTATYYVQASYTLYYNAPTSDCSYSLIVGGVTASSGVLNPDQLYHTVSGYVTVTAAGAGLVLNVICAGITSTQTDIYLDSIQVRPVYA